MHLFGVDGTLYGGLGQTFLQSLPYWIIDWQHTDRYLQELLDEYNRNSVGGPDRRDITTTVPQLPVGPENVLGSPAQPGIELSNLVIAEQQLPIPTPPLGETNVAMTDAEWLAAMGIPATGVAAPQLVANVQEEPTVGIFDDLGDIYTAVDAAVFGGNLPGGATPGGMQTLGPNTTTVLNNQPPGGAAPPPNAAVGAACAPGGGGASPVYKKVCGVYRWVYPKRRRRRALLTEGDYNSLLRIEGLKVNKNMTAAIAKALTR